MSVMTLSENQRQDLARILAVLRRTAAKLSLALATPQPLVVVMGYVEAIHATAGKALEMGLTIEDLVPYVTDPDPDSGLDTDRVMRILGIEPDTGDLP